MKKPVSVLLCLLLLTALSSPALASPPEGGDVLSLSSPCAVLMEKTAWPELMSKAIAAATARSRELAG